MAPSSVIRLSSQRKQSLPSLSCPASEITSWPTPSCRQPSPTSAQVRWSTMPGPKRRLRKASATAMPAALAMPWPSGPVVVSMPQVGIVFGVAFAVRAEFAEALDLVDGDLRVAAEVEQRVEQHGAVAVRLHEAVAVEPERVRGVELQVPREQRCADIGGAERRAGMPLSDALDRVHGEEADRMGHEAGIDVRHGSVFLRLAPCRAFGAVSAARKPQGQGRKFAPAGEPGSCFGHAPPPPPLRPPGLRGGGADRLFSCRGVRPRPDAERGEPRRARPGGPAGRGAVPARGALHPLDPGWRNAGASCGTRLRRAAARHRQPFRRAGRSSCACTPRRPSRRTGWRPASAACWGNAPGSRSASRRAWTTRASSPMSSMPTSSTGCRRPSSTAAPSQRGVVILPLGTEVVTPLCAPALAAEIRSPRDLLRHTLIESDNKRVRWPAWFAANGLPAPELARPALRPQLPVAERRGDGLGVALGIARSSRNASSPRAVWCGRWRGSARTSPTPATGSSFPAPNTTCGP